MGLWVPPTVSRELLDQRQQFQAEVLERVARAKLERVKTVLDQFNYELQRIDPLLEMVRASENTYGTPMKPGYYHIIRKNEGAPWSVFPIEGEHGEFVEPTSRVFEMLKRQDLWDPANMSVLRRRQRLADEAEARQRERDHAERREELMDRVNAATRTSVSMNPDVPWAQNAAGFKRTRGEKKRRER